MKQSSIFVPSLIITVLSRAIALTAPFVSLPVLAERVLEEVTVTAQLRNESLQDVSVSVAAVSGDKITDASITKIEDLQAYVPNLAMSETGIGTNIYIRGIGSGINQGFEQSVGMYVDGVYYGRAQLARAPFLDLERVEVLRGPQNILYGKNSIAGALSMVTRKPEQEFGASVSALYEAEFDEQVYDVVVNAPLSDALAARVAYRNRQLDGYVKNIDDGDEPDRDEQTMRLSLDWAINENLSGGLKYEYGEFDVKGRQIEIVQDNASPTLSGNPNWSQFLRSFGSPGSVLNVRQDARRSSNGDFSNNETQNITLTFDYSLDEYTLTSITSHVEYEYDELCDCDFTSANLFFVASEEEFDQFSQEFRIVSPADQFVEWIAGVYYQDTDLDFEDQFFVEDSSILPNVLDTILAAAPQFNIPVPPFAIYPVGPPGAAQQLLELSVPRQFDQESELWSAFFQATINVQDNLRVILGGRYSKEDKEAARVLEYSKDGTILPVDATFVPTASMGIDYFLGAILNVARTDLQGDRTEEDFAPAIILELDVNDELMAYASWTKGFKAGGFDVRSNAPDFATPIGAGIVATTVPAGSFEYEEEEAESIELGVKSRLLDNSLELNVAYFHTDYKDLQVSIYDGVLGFNVGNAAKATSQGVELDARYALTESITVSGAIAWTDFEFEDYPNGQCTQSVRVSTQLATGTAQTLCDFEGMTNQYVAEWSGFVSGDYYQPVSEALALRTTLDVVFSSDFNPSQNVDSAIQQGGYAKLNARVALEDVDSQWSIALVGKNLTDREIITYANDTPLSANLAQSSGFYALVEPGRTVALQGQYSF